MPCSAIRPFLASAGVDFGGFTPTGRIDQAAAAIAFDRSSLTSLHATLSLAGGRLGSIAFPPEGPLRQLDLALDGPAGGSSLTVELTVQEKPGAADRAAVL